MKIKKIFIQKTMDYAEMKIFNGTTLVTQILCIASFGIGFGVIISFNTSPILSSGRGGSTKHISVFI